jgi:hypothetical protein
MLGIPEAPVEGAPCCQESTPTPWAMFMTPLQPTWELLSSMPPRPMQQFPVFISQPVKDTSATGPLSEHLLSEVTLVSSCPRGTPGFQMIYSAIALDKLDVSTVCSLKSSIVSIALTPLESFFHITTGY